MAVDRGIIEKDQAVTATRAIKQTRQTNFNIGFRFQYSHLPAYECTGDNFYRTRAEQSLERLSNCFRTRPGIFFHNPQSNTPVTATDVMMNLLLPLWGIKQAIPTEKLKKMVDSSVSTACELFLDDNRSPHHYAILDPSTGTVDKYRNPQGIAEGCWSRGLAWMIYGLLLAGNLRSEPEWISSAKRQIEFHENHLMDGIAPYDYWAEEPILDTSTNVIIACAKLLHGRLQNDQGIVVQGKLDLKMLLKNHLREEKEPGLLDHTSYHVPREKGVNEATIWGDFYLLEAFWLAGRGDFPPHLRWLT